MTLYNLFPGVPDVKVFDGPNSGSQSANVATQFYVTAPGWVTQIRHLQGNTVAAGDLTWDQRVGAIWEVSAFGVSLGMVAGPFTLPAPTTNGSWTSFDLPVPFPLVVGKNYRVAVMYPTGGYPAQGAYFSGASDFVYGIVGVPVAANVPSNTQGSYKYTSFSSDFPYSSFNSTSYFSDVTISDVDPATAASVSLKHYESGLWAVHTAKPKVYQAGGWVTKTPKRWDGTGWVNL